MLGLLSRISSVKLQTVNNYAMPDTPSDPLLCLIKYKVLQKNIKILFHSCIAHSLYSIHLPILPNTNPIECKLKFKSCQLSIKSFYTKLRFWLVKKTLYVFMIDSYQMNGININLSYQVSIFCYSSGAYELWPCMVVRLQNINFLCFVEWFNRLFCNMF